MACSWKRRGESSHGYCTSSPGYAPPSISTPSHLEVERAAGNPHHARRRFGRRLCRRNVDDVLRQNHRLMRKAVSGFAVIAAMRCIRSFIAALGSPGVARIAP